MMVLAELAARRGCVRFSGVAGCGARAKFSERLFVLWYVVGVVVTALLSNDATAVVLTPACARGGAARARGRSEAVPAGRARSWQTQRVSFSRFPILQIWVVYGAKLPALREWLAIYGAAAAAAIIVTLLALWWDAAARVACFDAARCGAGKADGSGKLALAALVVAAAGLIVASGFGVALGFPTCLAAVLAMLVVMLRDRDLPVRVARGVSWSVLPLVAGLL